MLPKTPPPKQPQPLFLPIQISHPLVREHRYKPIYGNHKYPFFTRALEMYPQPGKSINLMVLVNNATAIWAVRLCNQIFDPFLFLSFSCLLIGMINCLSLSNRFIVISLHKAYRAANRHTYLQRFRLCPRDSRHPEGFLSHFCLQ